MVQYILFIIGFGLGNDNSDFIPWRGWEDRPNHAIAIREPKNNDVNKLVTKYSGRRSLLSRKNSTIRPIKNNLKKTYHVEIIELLRFVNKTKHDVLLEKSTSENNNYYDRRIECFDSLLQQWENEKIEIKVMSKRYEFRDHDIYIKYRHNSIVSNRWIGNYNEILIKYLPMIKNEIEDASIQGSVKRLLLEILESISRAMIYFVKLETKYLNYKYDYKRIVIYYSLLIYRLPYLFDYFDLVGKFIEVYEKIIDQYIKKNLKSNDMMTNFITLSKKITYLTKHRNNYLLRIKNNLTFLKNIKEIN
ncbi:uncharacterized protein VNE69_02026 [Vairimorpha necatrix]|uniref:Uncharacterized protein n=1 Tax=Vairimorpha necatrix TaxID=6039 RepID=A0AAX4J935_9MICR